MKSSAFPKIGVGETAMLLAALTNKAKYPNQKVLVVSFDGYVYLVLFVEEVDHFFPQNRDSKP